LWNLQILGMLKMLSETWTAERFEDELSRLRFLTGKANDQIDEIVMIVSTTEIETLTDVAVVVVVAAAAAAVAVAVAIGTIFAIVGLRLWKNVGIAMKLVIFQEIAQEEAVWIAVAGVLHDALLVVRLLVIANEVEVEAVVDEAEVEAVERIRDWTRKTKRMTKTKTKTRKKSMTRAKRKTRKTRTRTNLKAVSRKRNL